MNFNQELFENYLMNKNLKKRTIDNYMYYFHKFNINLVFNQESVSKFLSESANRNSIGRSFLVNLKKFLLVNYRELGIHDSNYKAIVETELPKLTGRVKRRLVNPLSHDQISLLEGHLGTEKLKLQLLITYYGGLRLGELLKIRILDFNWDDWKKNTENMGECRVFGKGDKEGIALFPPILMKRIANFIRNNQYTKVNDTLFVKDNDKDLRNKGRLWQLRLTDAGIRSGITALDDEGKPVKGTIVHPHRLRHCVSDDTEILTINGWKIRKFLKIGEICPTLNLTKDRIEFKPVRKIFSYDYNEPIFEIKNRYIQSQMTSEHNCLLRISKGRQKTTQKKKKRWDEWGKWELKTIKDLLKERNIRSIKCRASGISKGTLSIGEARAGILGWILTDAHFRKRGNGITIFQSLTANKHKCEIIENLLDKANLKYSKKIHSYKNSSGFSKGDYEMAVFRIFVESQAWIFEWVNKDRTPKYKLLQLKNSELKAIYTNMMLGDGTRGTELCNQNKKTIDFFRAMCSLLNYRTNLGTKKQRGKEYFRTYISKKNDFQIWKNQIKKVDYKGKVWCPDIENHTWIARSNEKIFITGNSWGSHLLKDKKLDIRIIQEALRHSSIQSTQIYTKINKEDLAESLKD